MAVFAFVFLLSLQGRTENFQVGGGGGREVYIKGICYSCEVRTLLSLPPSEKGKVELCV